MIAGYVQNERHAEAIELFRELRGQVSMKLNRALLVSVLSACGALGALGEGRWIHSYVDGNGMEYGLELGTALVDFYAKCGFIECARQVFDKMRRKDVTAWSAMIMGLALNGHCQSATETFSEMLKDK
nr:pentatricopeptide repeat protein AaPPR1503 [Agave angustifolia]